MGENARGALAMAAGMAAFVASDTCMKLLSAGMPLFQTITLRGIGVTFLLLLVARRAGALRVPATRADRRRIGFRAAAEAVGAYLYFFALFNMPLANVTAVLQALPLTITLGAALVLGEPVGWRRVTAILIGLGGVLLILRPGPEGFNLYALAALGTVLLVTARDLATRRLSPEVPSLLVALVTAATVAGGAAVASAAESWVAPSSRDAALLAAAAGCVFFGYLLTVLAMRQGAIGAVAPFRYMSLPVALVAGWAVFGEWPDALTLAGAALVVATGLYTLYRERRLGRAAAAQAAAAAPQA